MGGMPGCPAKPMDLASRGTLIWVPFATGSKDRGYDNFIPAVYIVQVLLVSCVIGVPPYCVHEFSIREALHYL